MMTYYHIAGETYREMFFPGLRTQVFEAQMVNEVVGGVRSTRRGLKGRFYMFEMIKNLVNRI